MTKKQLQKFKLSAQCDNLTGTCGVGVIYGFRDYNRFSDYEKKHQKELDSKFEGGTGYEVAGFIDDNVCKEAYVFLKEKYQIVFQSEIRLNTNSNNYFFFIIFDSKFTGVIDNSKFNWEDFPEPAPDEDEEW